MKMVADFRPTRRLQARTVTWHQITEKSNVYSFGVVLLEILTGKEPVEPTLEEGQQHVIQWVKDHLKKKKEPVLILDPKLQGHSHRQIEEMLQAQGISFLCTSNRPEDRPSMKDVAALLKEIGQKEPHKPTCNSEYSSR